MVKRPYILSNLLCALISSALAIPFSAGAAIGPAGESPGIVRTTPGENESEVSPNASIVVEFSKQIDPRSVTAESLRVGGAEGVVYYDPDSRSATWTPLEPLERAKQYEASVSGDVADLEGRRLPFPYRWTFSTRSAEETLLTIRQTTPTHNASHVPVNTPISVTFNKAIDPASLQPDSIAVIDEGKVKGSVDYDPVSKTITFLPATPLTYGQGYTVILKEGIKDPAGNRLSMAKSWSFTTEEPPLPVSTLDP